MVSPENGRCGGRGRGSHFEQCLGGLLRPRPAKDEWGLKYSGEVTATQDGKLNVAFTLADEGRLKPIHSVHVFALSGPDCYGSRTYLLKAPWP